MTVAEPLADVLSETVRRPLDEYLDRVEAVLRDDGASRSDRAAVCEEIETQVRETLAERRAGRDGAGDGGAEPVVAADVGSVVAELDPPEAYGTNRSSADKPEERMPAAAGSRVQPLAVVVFVLPLAALAYVILGSVSETQALQLVIGTEVIVCVLAWIGREAIRNAGVPSVSSRLVLSGLCLIPAAVLSLFIWAAADGILTAGTGAEETLATLEQLRQEIAREAADIRQWNEPDVERLAEVERNIAELDPLILQMRNKVAERSRTWPTRYAWTWFQIVFLALCGIGSVFAFAAICRRLLYRPGHIAG